jgi:hypothetical protein
MQGTTTDQSFPKTVCISHPDTILEGVTTAPSIRTGSCGQITGGGSISLWKQQKIKRITAHKMSSKPVQM